MYQTMSDVLSKPTMQESNFQFQLLRDRVHAIALSLKKSKSTDIQALTAAIKELAYTLNTYAISSLATTEDEHQHVRDRVMTRHEIKKEG